MKYLFLLAVLSGCGGAYHVDVDAVRVEHRIKLDDLEKYFRAYCEAQNLVSNPTPSPSPSPDFNQAIAIERCVNTKIAQFLVMVK